MFIFSCLSPPTGETLLVQHTNILYSSPFRHIGKIALSHPLKLGMVI